MEKYEVWYQRRDRTTFCVIVPAKSCREARKAGKVKGYGKPIDVRRHYEVH